MGKWKRRIGLVLLLVGAVLALIALGVCVSPARGQTPRDAVGVFVLALVFIVPGVVLQVLGRRDLHAEERRQTLVGYLKARSRVRVADAAAYLGISAFEAQRAIDAAISRREVDLVFKQSSEEYFQRAVVDTLHGRIVSTCGNCGATLREQVILPGEVPLCSFCGASLGDSVAGG